MARIVIVNRLLLALTGIGYGLAGAEMLTRVPAKSLFGVSPLDLAVK